MASAAAEAINEPLAQAYATSWQRVQAEQAAIANDPTKWRAQRRLREAQARISVEMRRLNAITRKHMAERFPDVYRLGVASVTGQAPTAFSMVHREAVETIAGGLYNDLLSATANVDKSTREFIRAVAGDEELRALVQGDTAQAAARRMSQIVQDKGIHAVRYSNGARHGLAEYSEMAIRTQTGVAYNTGVLRSCGQEGIGFVEVFDGPNCGWTSHDDNLANGKIVTLQEAGAHPLSHPNCRRAFGARPDIKSPEQAAQGGQTTPEQREAQLAQDRASPRYDRRREERVERMRADRHAARLSAHDARVRTPAAPNLSMEEASSMYDAAPGSEQDKAAAVYRALGYDGLPEVVPESQIAARAAEGPTGVLHRTFAEEDHLRQFREGQYYVGDGISGTGTYAVEGTVEEFREYVERALPFSAQQPANSLQMTMARDARVLDADRRVLRELSDGATGRIAGDPTLVAAVQGFDAVRLSRSTETFMIILNRARTIVAG